MPKTGDGTPTVEVPPIGAALFPNAEFLGDTPISFDFGIHQVIQQSASFTDELQETNIKLSQTADAAWRGPWGFA